MTIQKLKQHRSNIAFCASGCKEKISPKDTAGYRSASHLIRFLDHDATYLCSTCAEQWAKWWQEFGGSPPIRTMQRTKRDRGRMVPDKDLELVA